MAVIKKKTDDNAQEIMISLFNDQRNIAVQIMERTWFRNILYYMGEQWFEWARSQHTFRKIMPTPYMPTPVSNIIRDYVRSIKSLILNKDFVVSVWPNSNDQDDRDSAEMGERVLRWMETRHDEEELDDREMVAIWMILCGTAYDRTFPEMDNDRWTYDASGNIIPTGDVVTESVSPFMVRVDDFGNKFRHKRYVGIKSLKPREWVEDTFKTKVAGSSKGSDLVNYERRLAHLVGNVSAWKGEGIEFQNLEDMADDEMVMFKEVEFRPTKQYPNGRYIVGCDDQTIKSYDRMPIPVDRKNGRWYYSLTDYHYNLIPGRFYSDAGVNDLISPQNTINQIDQDLEVNRRGVGQPMVLLGSDVVLKRVTGYGQKLMVLKYDSFLSGGVKPEFRNGTPLPSQVLQERDVHRASAQDAAGDPKNVLRGNAPSSSASGIMVDILRDAAEQGHTPDISRFYRSLKRTKRKKLILAQEVYTEERLAKIPDKKNKYKMFTFRGADLRDNNDVRLELASGMASTKTGQGQMILKLTESGFFNVDSPLDPEHKEELLHLMGLGSFKDKRNVDVDRAMRENNMTATFDPRDMTPVTVSDGQGSAIQIPIIPGLFLAMGDPAQGEEGIVLSDDPYFKFDDHNIHYETHRRFILSGEFRELPPPIQEGMIAHVDVHKMMIDAQAMEAAQKAAMVAEAGGLMPGEMPPGAPSGGGNVMQMPGISPQEAPRPRAQGR